MMDRSAIVFLVPAVGALLALIGHVGESTLLFGIGVAVCVLDVAMDVTSGTMPLPVIPAVLVLIGAASTSPPWYGAGAGLAVWCGLSALLSIWKSQEKGGTTL